MNNEVGTCLHFHFDWRIFDRISGESIPVFLNNREGEDPQNGLINPIKPEIPVVGRQYVSCVYDDLKQIDCLIEIEWNEIDELVQTANARRKSIV